MAGNIYAWSQTAASNATAGHHGSPGMLDACRMSQDLLAIDDYLLPD